MANVKLSTKAVGSIVKIKVNGAAKDFIIVHQGLPSSAYDASCNGVWVVMKDIYTTMKWDGSNNDYLNSDMTAYLNGTFISLIDADIRNAIKQVKIPYTNYSNNNVMSGSNGLSCKVFLLSGTEVGFSGVSYMNTEGAKLSYFGSASKRVAYNGSSAAEWWLRSPRTDSSGRVWYVRSDGSNAAGSTTTPAVFAPLSYFPLRSWSLTTARSARTLPRPSRLIPRIWGRRTHPSISTTPLPMPTATP